MMLRVRLVFCVAAAACLANAAPLAVAQPTSEPTAVSTPTSQPHEWKPEQQREIYFYAASLAAALVVLMAGVAIYLILRFGRTLKRSRVGGKETEYVDAWSRYRLTEEEIDASTAEPPGDAEERDHGAD